jgi:hypothetical protein
LLDRFSRRCSEPEEGVILDGALPQVLAALVVAESEKINVKSILFYLALKVK